MIRLLLVDTCGSEGSVALAGGGALGEVSVVASEVLPGRSSSERLVPAVRQMLERQGWGLRELAGIVVARGPGSFTGVRVGLSAAKGWSEAAGVSVIALSRLQVMARANGAAHGWAVLDAARGEYYVGEYVGEECIREVLMSGEEFRRAAAGAPLVVCEAKTAEALRDLSPRRVPEPLAADLVALGLSRLERREFEDVATLDATYLRRMEQEISARLEARRR